MSGWRAVPRLVLCTSLMAGVYVGSSELVYPYYTVSDVLATRGGLFAQTGILVSTGLFVALHGPSACPIAALLVLLFPLPLGTPFVLEHVPVAPIGCLLHMLAALAYIASIAVDIVVPTSVLRCLLATFAASYYVGLHCHQPTLVLAGCVLEWMLLFIPCAYPHRLERASASFRAGSASRCEPVCADGTGRGHRPTHAE